MSFGVNYNAGGVIDEVKKIHFPPNVFPNERYFVDYTKGLRISVDARVGEYSAEFIAPWDCHLVSVTIVCTGYFDGDFWEMLIGQQKRIETCYTKEVPETKALTKMFETHPANSRITLKFQNASGTSKQVYFDLEFLHG